jgi:16S rRNA (uracil1498-N3)-methyltransferase
MASPYFYEEHIPEGQLFNLNEDTSRHVIQVLRMREGEQLIITNGKGQVLIAEIVKPDKISTSVKRISVTPSSPPANKIIIALSLLKNEPRFEWFLEKATEIGVKEIIPLVCERTEKQHFRYERMNKIMISAMLQSQQSWLPVLRQPVKFNDVVQSNGYDKRFIAHCLNENKLSLHIAPGVTDPGNKIILIGPEGDFTSKEIELSVNNNFTPVSLGNTRLRSETAGIYAAVILQSAVDGGLAH